MASPALSHAVVLVDSTSLFIGTFVGSISKARSFIVCHTVYMFSLYCKCISTYIYKCVLFVNKDDYPSLCESRE